MNQENQRIQYYKEKFQAKWKHIDIETTDETEKLYLYAMVPVLIEYVTWVMLDAIAAGKKRLYFLARDGYQMYLVAKRMAEVWNVDMECRYISVSRFAMRIPEYHLLGETCIEQICVGGIDVTFEKICKRAGFSEKEAMEIAKECGWADEFKRVLNYQEVMKLKETLGKCSSFFEKVYEYSKKAYPNAIGYLEQEGLFEDVPFAFVDSGWVGTLQQTIQNLLQSRKPEAKVEGYYFGMYEYPKGVERNNYHPFYFSPTRKLKRKVHFSNCLFEAIFSAPEGMTLRYEWKCNQYKPVLDSNENPNVNQLKKDIVILNTFLENYNEVQPKQIQISYVEDIVRKFMGNPTKAELKAYGGTLFSDDVLEEQLQKVSAELSQEEIKKQRFLSKVFIMTGIKKDVIHESAWIEGSIVNNGIHVKANLKHAHLYKYFIYIRKWLQQGGKN